MEWFDQMGPSIITGVIALVAIVVNRRDKLADSVNALAERVARLEARFDALESRFDTLESRFDTLDATVRRALT